MKISPIETRLPQERAFIVGVEIRGQDHILDLADSLTELALLADTAGMVVAGSLSQRLDTPNQSTLLGSGKLQELRDLMEENNAGAVIFDDELSPRHQRELERVLGNKIKVLDRTALILDIFAQHARTSEGALQVELAQYEYRLPRLTRMWTHLARQAGGGSAGVGSVGLRGPGETQLEVDRRDINRRISHLKQELEKVRAHRVRHRQQRQRAEVPLVALVGYTNAGKSTLLKALSGADVYIANQLFATLDPTTRQIALPNAQKVLLTDTVGFIQKLPTALVAAFRATLEEVVTADLLLHVVDVSHPNALEHIQAVSQTLQSLDAAAIPSVLVFNKIDLLPDSNVLDALLVAYPDALGISAVTQAGLPELLAELQGVLTESFTPVRVRLPFERGDLLALFHEHGQIETLEHQSNSTLIVGRLPSRLLRAFSPYQIYVQP
jgi:GTP-binding protein HflX